MRECNKRSGVSVKQGLRIFSPLFLVRFIFFLLILFGLFFSHTLSLALCQPVLRPGPKHIHKTQTKHKIMIIRIHYVSL